ncbi:MAG: hypothetical protein ACI8PQ_003464 [Planctomycetota bacterium]|jgi:hypothetical protein
MGEVDSARSTGRGKWSAREVLGHLVDSATNNQRRFVEAQLGEDLVFPGYDQDAWVAVQRYREANWSALVNLWGKLNLHVAHMMRRHLARGA